MAVRTQDPQTREMLAYSLLVIREALHHGGNGWQEYDQSFRRQAAIDSSLPWNSLSPCLQASTLISNRSGMGTFCTICCEPDHVTSQFTLAILQQPVRPPVSVMNTPSPLPPTLVDLPFGLHSPPKLFTAFADMVAWAIYRHKIRYVLHYLDDFLLLGAPDSSEATMAALITTKFFSSTGIPVDEQKTEGPTTSFTFLGILIDTSLFQLRLSPEKLIRLRSLVEVWQAKKSCTCKELESFVGDLASAATVIYPGRIFLWSMFLLLSTTAKPHFKFLLNTSVHADLQWWHCFLQLWNGLSFFPLPS